MRKKCPKVKKSDIMAGFQYCCYFPLTLKVINPWSYDLYLEYLKGSHAYTVRARKLKR